MLHRIFLAINLPDNIKRKLISLKDKWIEIPARWTKEPNLHVTLLFLGNLDDNQLSQTIKVIQEVTTRHTSFVLNLRKVCFGPTDEKNSGKMPRMIWVEGEGENKLLQLQQDLDKTIFNLESFQYKERDEKPFKFHITLARIKQWEFKKLEEIPKIDEEINLKFEANTFELMESQLKKGGPEHTILESFELSGEEN